MSESSSDELGLAGLRKVKVIEQDKVRENCCMCIEKGEKQFGVLNEEGHKIFNVVEDKDMCCQHCGCCFERDFNLWVRVESEGKDNKYKMRAERNCCSWLSCLSCCRKNIDVSTKSGGKIGSVESDCQVCCACYPKFTVTDKTGASRFNVSENANLCAYCICCGASSRYCCGIKCYIPSALAIKPVGGGASSRIEHDGDGGRTDDADAYIVMFPEESTPDDKMLLIAATILVDYKMFSDSGPQKQHMASDPV